MSGPPSLTLVATSVAVKHDSRYPAAAFEAASGGRSVSVTIRVTEDPKPARPGPGYGERAHRQSSRGSIIRLAVGDQVFPVEAPERVFITGDARRAASDVVGAAGGVAAPDPPDNRFAESSIRIGAALQVAGTVRSLGPQDQVVALVFARGSATVVAAPAWLNWAGELRAGFSRAVSDSLDQAMKDSSLSHLTAVSGDTASYRGAYEDSWQL